MITLRLPFPPSVNKMWRCVGGRTLLSKEGRAYKRDAHGWLQTQRCEPLDGRLSVDIVFYFPNRRGDLDNRCKPILDVLQGVAYHNDSQVDQISLRRELGLSPPRAIVTVHALDG